MPSHSPWSRRVADLLGVRIRTGGTNTTSAAIPWRGTQILSSTQAAKKYTLKAPVPAKGGVEVTLVCQKGTTTNTSLVILPTGWYFQLTSNSTAVTTRKATFNAGNQSLTLRTISTARVAILANVNTVALATT